MLVVINCVNFSSLFGFVDDFRTVNVTQSCPWMHTVLHLSVASELVIGFRVPIAIRTCTCPHGRACRCLYQLWNRMYRAVMLILSMFPINFFYFFIFIAACYFLSCAIFLVGCCNTNLQCCYSCVLCTTWVIYALFLDWVEPILKQQTQKPCINCILICQCFLIDKIN